ncbi:hypothetical protein MON38_05135 [Hymenobacter sp. DH14]|uniref:Uncharacterized protein n=1 Tax=Hymenobacter cyanobacteriorum TaxID=2926463 RepID=A0A9X1VDV8_9BACT|nr:hypothetical protein [Hymenobacter cyanobacteriorum]MCI1186793.1 hypothetical protein [Hymenobacter cyanobacteriorum]
MKPSSLARISRLSLLAAALVVVLPACQPGQARLAQLEAAQQQQAREIAALKQQLAEREEEVAQLETCVDDLENTVYEDEDSVAYDEERPAGPVAL